MPSRLEDEKHWRKRAAEMRSLAAAMPDHQQSVLMTDLAEEYDRLADKAALRPKGRRPNSAPHSNRPFCKSIICSTSTKPT
jgi:hypothetical protein